MNLFFLCLPLFVFTRKSVYGHVLCLKQKSHLCVSSTNEVCNQQQQALLKETSDLTIVAARKQRNKLFRGEGSSNRERRNQPLYLRKLLMCY